MLIMVQRDNGVLAPIIAPKHLRQEEVLAVINAHLLPYTENDPRFGTILLVAQAYDWLDQNITRDPFHLWLTPTDFLSPDEKGSVSIWGRSRSGTTQEKFAPNTRLFSVVTTDVAEALVTGWLEHLPTIRPVARERYRALAAETTKLFRKAAPSTISVGLPSRFDRDFDF